MDGIVAVRARGEVGVAIDEAGEDEVGGEIDDGGAWWDGEGGVFDGADAVAFENEDDMGTIVAGAAVEQIAGFDVGDCSGGGEGAHCDKRDEERGSSGQDAVHVIPLEIFLLTMQAEMICC